MNSADILKGQQLMVFLNGKAIAWATSCALNVTAGTSEISTKDHGFFGATSVTSISWEVSSENLAAHATYDELYKMMAITREPVQLVFGRYTDNAELATSGIADSSTDNWTAPYNGTTNEAATPSTYTYYTGKANITTLNLNAPNGDNATFSVTFSGVGELRQVEAD